jgi:branched-chain amino acid transport system substrate-binding protein
MAKYIPDGDLKDGSYPFAYGVARTMMQVLQQCSGNFARDAIMHQVANLKALDVPTLLPGITVNTAPDNFHPIRQMQLQKWTGSTWERFGSLIEGAKV